MNGLSRHALSVAICSSVGPNNAASSLELGISIALIHQVAIAIQRDLHARVAKLLGDQLRMLPLRDQQGRKAVAEVVESDLREFRSLKRRLELAPNQIHSVKRVPFAVQKISDVSALNALRIRCSRNAATSVGVIATARTGPARLRFLHRAFPRDAATYP